ncbi:hypothetical protein M8818_000209 [Zalaria obscura]|uniref:Uncharacterized protein n=1 Tax=Zalaria obscura TaxID=2024903 RepID=A0ACC3SP00_9PEZI
MSSQRYERVAANDEDDSHISSQSPHHQPAIPNSPPPSFRSRASSRRTSAEHDPQTEVERSLTDAFAGSPDDESDDEQDDSRRLVNDGDRSPEQAPSEPRPGNMQRRVTQLPVFTPSASRPTGRIYGGGNSTTDGVFANISAKPTRGEELEEKPPTYEQAAADATPPYWETTILAPGGINSDDVFVDGLIVGSLFSFVWNALISMSFQLIGFLLTYLLHTTHAAKHGSLAGLGITLIQYGFTMRATPDPTVGDGGPNGGMGAVPADPNAHDFDPNQVAGDAAAQTSGDGTVAGISTADWMSYALMIVGWFILIRAVSNFIRARRQEQLVRASPDRGLGTPIVAVNETPETAV